MHVGAVPVDALGGGRDLVKIVQWAARNTWIGARTPCLFLFLELIKGRFQSAFRISWSVHLFGSQQSWEDTSCALQIGLLWFCLLNIRGVIHILTEWIHERSRGVVLTLSFGDTQTSTFLYAFSTFQPPRTKKQRYIRLLVLFVIQ
jgi:hypothetical protein